MTEPSPPLTFCQPDCPHVAPCQILRVYALPTLDLALIEALSSINPENPPLALRPLRLSSPYTRIPVHTSATDASRDLLGLLEYPRPHPPEELQKKFAPTFGVRKMHSARLMGMRKIGFAACRLLLSACRFSRCLDEGGGGVAGHDGDGNHAPTGCLHNVAPDDLVESVMPTLHQNIG